MTVLCTVGNTPKDSLYTASNIDLVGGATGMTAFFVFKPTSSTFNGRLMSQWSAAGNEAQWLMFVSDSNTISFIMNQGPTGTSKFNGKKSNDAGMSINNTYRIMVTWGTGTPNVVTMSLNGTTLTMVSNGYPNNQNAIQAGALLPLYIGAELSSGTDCTTGERCEVALWDTVVGTQESRNDFTAGNASPLTMERQNLRWYSPCHTKDDARDYITGTALAVSGSAATASHPPIAMPQGQVIPFPPAAAPAGTRAQGPFRHPFYGPFAGPIG